jgi:hypothetical protein
MAGEMSINLAQYAEKKAKGAAKLVNVEGKLHYIERRFHQETGEPTPVLVPVSVEALEQARANMTKDLDALDQVIADAKTVVAGPVVGSPA